ncbi:MAG: FKBP-type peptidyl-prolyl cis-trans isomerase [Actinomycetes bacterium]
MTATRSALPLENTSPGRHPGVRPDAPTGRGGFRRLVAGVAALAIAGTLAACSSSSGSTPSATSSSTSSATLPTVVGALGSAPTITLPKTAPPSAFSATVLHQGGGATVARGQLVIANYVAEIWNSGKVFDSSWKAGYPDGFPLVSGAFPAFVDGLVGKKIGSRVLLVVPPAQGFGSTGQTQLGITGTDTLVFVVDITAAYPGTAAATGKPTGSSTGLAKVTVGTKGVPAVTIPTGAKPPTTLTKTVLLAGSGPVVTKGQLLVVQYVGVNWNTGKVFDSSWSRSMPATFPIGVGQVIPGWDKTLVGVRVGSRVMLTIPPVDGYGTTGNSQAGISGTDTLVFVIDVLGAY